MRILNYSREEAKEIMLADGFEVSDTEEALYCFDGADVCIFTGNAGVLMSIEETCIMMQNLDEAIGHKRIKKCEQCGQWIIGNRNKINVKRFCDTCAKDVIRMARRRAAESKRKQKAEEKKAKEEKAKRLAERQSWGRDYAAKQKEETLRMIEEGKL